MKKYILSIGIAACSLTQANAQVVMGGPELGLNFSTMSQRVNGDKLTTDMLLGLRAGAVLDVTIAPHVSLQPGLYFNRKGYANNYSRTVVLNNLTYTDNYDQTVKVNYLEIPINLLYKSELSGGSFFIGGGPYVAMATTGEVSAERTRRLQTANGDGSAVTESIERTLEIGNSNNDDIKPVDVGLNITGGYEFASGIFARGNAGLGLANIQPNGNNDNSLRNFSVGVSVGYLFGK